METTIEVMTAGPVVAAPWSRAGPKQRGPALDALSFARMSKARWGLSRESILYKIIYI